MTVVNNLKFFNPCPGGVCPSERGLVWRFLFGMYPCSSTALERSLLQEQMVVRYQVMKRKWQQFLPKAVRMHLNGTDGKTQTCNNKVKERLLIMSTFQSFFKLLWTHYPVFIPAELVAAVRHFDQRQAQAQQQTQDQSEEVRDRLAFLELQAQVRGVYLIYSTLYFFINMLALGLTSWFL